jgi:hypothetical protein
MFTQWRVWNCWNCLNVCCSTVGWHLSECLEENYEYLFIHQWLYRPLMGPGHFFFSFVILYTVGRTPWKRISPSQGRYLHTEQHKYRINVDIHVSSGIRTHDPSVWGGEGSSCPRPRGHCDEDINLLHSDVMKLVLWYFMGIGARSIPVTASTLNVGNREK